jgi:sulfur-oxidizing protein SoxX
MKIIKHVLIGLILMSFGSMALASDQTKLVAEGKALYLNKKKGNCIACHMSSNPDDELPGMQGPPLLAMQQRYPDIKQLRAQIWDATVRNPRTIMPPFGRHWILSEEEIDAIVAYVYQL